MADKIDLTEVDIDDLIDEIIDRGHSVDRESDIDDFSDEELLEALGVEQDDTDWNEMYAKIMCGNGEQAFDNFKQIVEEKTGRIIV